MLAERPSNHRKVLVFLTDGLPGTLTKTAEIINRAIALDIEIHVITIGLTIPATLRQIAEATGGTWYSNVNSSAEMEGIYRTIAIRNQGYAPCTLRWNVQPICGIVSIFRTAEIQLVPYNKKAVSAIHSSRRKNGRAGISASVSLVWRLPGRLRILQCTITARRGKA